MNRPEAGLPYPYYLFVCIYFCKYNMLPYTFAQKRFWSRDRQFASPRSSKFQNYLAWLIFVYVMKTLYIFCALKFILSAICVTTYGLCVYFIHTVFVLSN